MVGRLGRWWKLQLHPRYFCFRYLDQTWMARKCRVKALHCDMCGRVFTKTSHLGRHIHVHSEGMLKNVRHINWTVQATVLERHFHFHSRVMLKNVRHVKRFSLRYKSEKSTTEEAHSYSQQVERFHCKMCGKTFTDIKCPAINLTVKNVQIYSYKRLY